MPTYRISFTRTSRVQITGTAIKYEDYVTEVEADSQEEAKETLILNIWDYCEGGPDDVRFEEESWDEDYDCDEGALLDTFIDEVEEIPNKKQCATCKKNYHSPILTL